MGSALRNAVADVADGPISFVCPKETGERKRQQGEGFLPDALPLHPFLLTLRSVRPHIWAGCTRPPPLPKRILCTASLDAASKPLRHGFAVTAPLTSKGSLFCAVQYVVSKKLPPSEREARVRRKKNHRSTVSFGGFHNQWKTLCIMWITSCKLNEF